MDDFMENTMDKIQGRVVVVDTSSLLNVGVDLLQEIPSCEFVIPTVVVKELESKRTSSTVGYVAREWLRFLEDLRVEYGAELSSGVDLDMFPGKTLRIEPNNTTQSVLPKYLQDGSNDSTILAVAVSLNRRAEEYGNPGVVLVSNDVPMLLHANVSLGLDAVEFSSVDAHGANVFDGRLQVSIDEETHEAISRYHGDEYSKKMVAYAVSQMSEDEEESHLWVSVHLEGDDPSEVLFSFLYEPGDESYSATGVQNSVKASKISAKSLEQRVAMTYLKRSDRELPVVSVGGAAGSGKTLISLACGLEQVGDSKPYKKVMVFRSLHEMGEGQEMGFLPGSVEEKMSAWAGAVHDAVDVIAGANVKTNKNAGHEGTASFQTEVKNLREKIEIHPITYLRGRSIANTFIIIEEAQNFSRSELLHVLSRVGRGSKVVLTFDAAQVDNKRLPVGNKADVWSVIDSFRCTPIFAHITLQNSERSVVAETANRIINEG